MLHLNKLFKILKNITCIESHVCLNELLVGGYPDLRNQVLEVKIQDSPTVDLGQ